MKIIDESKLTEAKEALPVSFLTDFISKGWDEVGFMKADIEAIKDTYKGANEVAALIQGLIDAYLICIGQLEAHLSDKKYIEYPDESKLAGAKNESLKEDVDIHVSDSEVTVSDSSSENVVTVPIGDAKPENAECEGGACDMPPAEADIKPISDNPLDEPFEFDGPIVEPSNDKPAAVGDTFDYFVDFDDPVGEPVSEKELYGEGEEAAVGKKTED